MNKKLIVTAMALALAGGTGLANAGVNLYGQLTMSIDKVDEDEGTDDTNMNSTQSAIGIKGSEDLGNGVQAVFQVEYEADIDDSGSWTGRDQFVGVQYDNFGKLIFGTVSTAYKSASVALDPFYRMPIQARAVGIQSVLHSGKGEEGQGRAQDTIRYDSPSWSGVGLTATYTLDSTEDDNGNGSTSDPGDEGNDPYSAGVTYTGGPVYAFASYITTDSGSNDDAWQVGAKGSFGDAAVWAMYEADGGLITTNTINSLIDTYLVNADCVSLGFVDCADFKAQARGAGDSQNIWNVGGSYKISNNLLSASYGEADDMDFGGGLEFGAYSAWNVGAQHMFSDRTRVFLGYANRDYDDFGEADIVSLGMRHNF